MDNMKLRAITDEQGRIRLDVPTGLPHHEFDILISIEPVEEETLDEMGYPIGYFEETYGILADEPMERPAQLPFDVRDDFE